MRAVGVSSICEPSCRPHQKQTLSDLQGSRPLNRHTHESALQGFQRVHRFLCAICRLWNLCSSQYLTCNGIGRLIGRTCTATDNKALICTTKGTTDNEVFLMLTRVSAYDVRRFNFNQVDLVILHIDQHSL